MYKLISNLLLLTFIFLLSLNSFAYKNDFSLKTGFLYSQTKFNKLGDDDFKEEDEAHAFGVYTSFGYTWERVEMGLESRLSLSKEAELSFKYQDVLIVGKGSLMSVDITPFIKIHSKTFFFNKRMQSIFESINLTPWYAYFKIGPSWVIHTVDLDNFMNSISAESKDHKISYESIGFSMSIGIEEDLPNKDLHSCFFEISIAAYDSYKVSVVDVTNSKEVNILTTQESKQEIQTYQFLAVVGFTLF